MLKIIKVLSLCLFFLITDLNSICFCRISVIIHQRRPWLVATRSRGQQRCKLLKRLIRCKTLLTVSALLFSILVGLHEEGEVVSCLLLSWEASLNNSGVGEQNSVEGESSSFDWVFVHFLFILNNYKTINYLV
jgi:hypothetical protein